MDEAERAPGRIPDVSAEIIQNAAEDFDRRLRPLPEWQGWMEDARFRWALSIGDRLYPVKQILRQATGAETFSGGPEANGYLERRGFSVIPLASHERKAGLMDEPPATAAEPGFDQVLDHILQLQAEYVSTNSAPMQRRGELVRNVGPRLIRHWLSGPGGAGRRHLSAEGRDGTGRKTRVPWFRVFADELSPSATQGWYVVYLFAFDGSAVYLSLNQGTTTPTGGQFVPRPAEEIRSNVQWAEEVIGSSVDPRMGRDIALDSDGLGRGYESGNVSAYAYERGAIPAAPELFADLGRMLDLLELLYEREKERRPPPEEDVPGAPVADLEEFTFEQLVALTLWTPKALGDLIDALRGDSRQLVLAGPPGTGKTWVARQIVRYLTQGNPDLVRLVQFHPSYSYEQFMEGLRPALDKNNAIEFRPVPGVILEMASSIQPGSADHFLIIDEMNRANLPRVLGELMFLFEYREEKIDLPYTRDFQLPAELRVIGTMNTADRSIRSIDVALRRRFDIISCLPDVDILSRYYSTRRNIVPDLVSGFHRLNQRLAEDLDPYHTIGHTFFMAPEMDAKRLLMVWERQLQPLVAEYFFDQPDKASQYQVEELWPSLSDI